MPISRRALLISNPGETWQEHYCKGVYVDIKNYQRLLSSPQGGDWNPNEITTFDRPSAGNVREWINRMSSADYVFVMFTGHGWFSSMDHDRILELRAGESIASNELLKGTKRRSLILDCCQKVYQQSLNEKVAHILNASSSPELREPNRAACRKTFLDSIAAAPEGFLRLSSCSVGEYSYDDDIEGARFNSSLIETCNNWSNSQASRPSGTASSLSLVAAHEVAAMLTAKLSGGVQNPSIEKPKSGPYFPLAVFV